MGEGGGGKAVFHRTIFCTSIMLLGNIASII